MSIKNFKPTVWSVKLFQELDKNHVLVGLCNREYEGEITAYGDQVKINALGDIDIGNYQPNVTEISPQQLDGQQKVLEIDQAKYFAFYIDDVDYAQTKPKLMNEAMRKSAYGLADAADQTIAGFYTDAATTISGNVTLANVLTFLSNAALQLDNRDVPSQGRWMVIPPWFRQKLTLNKVLETDGSVDANEAYTNGYVGKAFGFDFYVSNNLSTGGSTGAIGSHRALAGTSRAISFADQIVETEAYRPEKSFSDAVKGLHVYGAKTIDSNALISIDVHTSSAT